MSLTVNGQGFLYEFVAEPSKSPECKFITSPAFHQYFEEHLVNLAHVLICGVDGVAPTYLAWRANAKYEARRTPSIVCGETGRSVSQAILENWTINRCCYAGKGQGGRRCFETR